MLFLFANGWHSDSFSTKWEAFHYLQLGKALPAGAGKRGSDDANLASLSLLPAPHPSLACGLGRSRAGLLCRVHAAFLSSLQPPPRRARSKAVAPALSAAIFLAMLLGAARICTTGILNAGKRLPGLCALHDAALLVCLRPARRRASTPCIHMQKWRSRSVGLGELFPLFFH